MEKVHPPKYYWANCGWLMLLLAATWGLGYVNLGVFNLPLALVISVAKTVLIVLFFMHLKGSSRLLHLAAFAGLVWLFLMFLLTFADYFTRGWVTPGH